MRDLRGRAITSPRFLPLVVAESHRPLLLPHLLPKEHRLVRGDRTYPRTRQPLQPERHYSTQTGWEVPTLGVSKTNWGHLAIAHKPLLTKHRVYLSECHQTANDCSHVSAVAGSTWLKLLLNEDVRRFISRKIRSTAFRFPSRMV